MKNRIELKAIKTIELSSIIEQLYYKQFSYDLKTAKYLINKNN